MALLHAQAGEVVDVGPLGDSLPETKTCALVKTQNFEVIRMVMLAGKEVAEHRAKGEIIVHCLEGSVLFNIADKQVELKAGNLIHLKAGERHALNAISNSSLLLTMFLHPDSANA